MICEEQVKSEHDQVVKEYKLRIAVDLSELEQYQEAQQGCVSTTLYVARDAGCTFP